MRETRMVHADLLPAAYAALFLVTRNEQIIGIVGRYRSADGRWTWATVIGGDFRAGSAADAAGALEEMDRAILEMEASDAPAA